MNVNQIKNGEVRVFPFYDGKYMGYTPIGYSSVKSAKKYMKLIPAADIYDEYFGGEENYYRIYGYFWSLSSKDFFKNVEEKYGLKLFEDGNERIPFKDIPKEQLNDMFEMMKLIHDHGGTSTKEGVLLTIEFEEKYKCYPFGYNRDYTGFNEMYDKHMKEHVEFKEGVLDINVKWSDGTVSKAPLMNPLIK